MAAFTTGATWGFPQDLPEQTPGSWSQDDIDAQIHSENDSHSSSRPQPTPTTASSEAPPNPNPQERPRRTHYPPRTCRICFDVVRPTFHTGEDSTFPGMTPTPRVTYESLPGDGGRLLRPCKCKGTQKYVHEECLGEWRRHNPLEKRNYFACPTCGFNYNLQRLTWGSWLSSTTAQIALTVLIFVSAMFLLGFVADPIINLYLDPVNTIATAGGPTGSLIFEDEPASWTEHFVKGLASLGLLGFAKFLATLSPWHWFNMRGGVVGRSGGVQGTGRDRLQQLSWITIMIGVATFLWAVWKGVRAWSRKTLEKASEKVMDVPGDDDDEEEEEDEHQD